MKKFRLVCRPTDESGAIAIIAAITLPLFLGFAAIAIDLSHLYVVRNELQNAADAGALAGARVLYDDEGTSVNENANQTAYDAAVANWSQKTPAEVNWQGGNEGDVQRGHWSFATRTFTPNPSLVPADLWNVSTEELDANPDFINAVRVKTRREANPVTLFFARILGKETAKLSAEAVAYRGFAGSIDPYEAMPIVICRESILTNADIYTCNVGRMINSGQNIATNETGGWTDFNWDDPCTGGTNASAVRDKIIGGGNPEPVYYNREVATNGGEIQSAFGELLTRWEEYKNKGEPWKLTLPVITCPDNNIGTCEMVVGAVEVNVVWITGTGEDPSYTNVPYKMGGWSSSAADGLTRWSEFVTYFNLQNVDGSPAPYAKKSIYFKPDCTYHEPTGISGGENFGVLSKVPVLVK
jgi:type II secretory pathway pseudopilin PulG